MASCADKLSSFLWREGEPQPSTVIKSDRLPPESLFRLRAAGLFFSCVGWIFMLIVNASNHFIYLTYWAVYLSVAGFLLLLLNHHKFAKYQSSNMDKTNSGKSREMEITNDTQSALYPHRLLWLFTVVEYECTVPLSMVVGFVYWTTLFRGGLTAVEYVASTTTHGIIQIFWILEFYFDTMPFFRHHYWIFFWVGIVYMIWNCIWSLTMYPVYGNFTTWKNFLTVIFVLAAMLLATAGFFILEKLYRKKVNKDEKTVKRDDDGKEMSHLKQEANETTEKL
mmetsp:Transcript_64494/g.74059  ORF Transcript_64494/g.74059 Transcript_64494/m.74059 type:complete len:280 (+) Transcript_64494:1838-2677(+)